MTMTISGTTTPRLGLLLIEPGQAQKEWFHNESLLLLDGAVQASVTAVGTDTPPAAAVPGDGWVIGDAPTENWSDHARDLAIRTEGGWRFLAPFEGMAVWDRATGCVWRHRAGMWLRGNAIVPPTGGATIDQEARRAVAAMIELLRDHGLTAA
jgi:hypothetical protein